ncbi:MAG: DUF4136 domain-containing protein [Xanthomonadales bacterium]|nr:DUF4136 domain-containing protein [Gammaproteobacteria bacterium]MBT8055148.1 DUF4136 domain-containing protein [Gammaproteobacteria bacterium]NND58363.1 DUF4136 domain-containing protein [Xanthomonadales bacterium]NNK51742.1 DUF4136 domain-containing protein [Xanthomonadales bacterium]
MQHFLTRCRQHRGLLAVVPVLLVTLFTGACSSGLAVRSDEDPSADFSRYSSWNFFDPMGIEGGNNSAIFGELFREAITREMTERGYRRSETPDLMINVSMRNDDKVSMRTYSAPYMSGTFYNRPGGYYGSSMGLGVGVGSRATRTTEVSVFIDLVDREQQRVSWQGVAVTDASDKTAQRLRDAIYTAVNVVFDQYPHQAGK